VTFILQTTPGHKVCLTWLMEREKKLAITDQHWHILRKSWFRVFRLFLLFFVFFEPAWLFNFDPNCFSLGVWMPKIVLGLILFLKIKSASHLWLQKKKYYHFLCASECQIFFFFFWTLFTPVNNCTVANNNLLFKKNISSLYNHGSKVFHH
jgi:hypothetical protein